MARVEIPAPGDLIMDEAGNVLEGVAVTLTLAGTVTDATHYSAPTGGTSATGGLVTASDGTIVDGSGNRRYVTSGQALDLTIAGRSRQIEPVSASVVGDPTTTDYTPTWRNGVGLTVWVRPSLINPYSSEYGVTGDGTTDDRAGLQAALNRGSVMKAGVGLAETDHMISSGVLTLPSAVPLVGQGAASRLLQGYWTADAPLISATGSLGTSTLITTNAQDNGSFTIAVASTAGLAANDWVVIGSTAAFNLTAKAELSRIKTIDSPTQITLWGMMRDQYLTADAAYVRKVNFVRNLELRDLAIVNTSPERLASAGAPLATFTYCRGVEANGLYLSGSDSAGVRLDSCIDASVDNGVFEDFADNNANAWFGYGVELRGATENAKVHGVTFRRVRHGVTTTTGGAAIGVPRNCLIEACVGDATTAPAFDTHEDCDHITFDGCSATNIRSFAAFQVRGKNIRILGASVAWCAGGVTVVGTTQGLDIRGSTFRHLMDITAADGISVASAMGVNIVDNTIEHVARHGINVTGNPSKLLIERNRIVNPGVVNASSKGIVYAGAGTAANNRILNNDIEAYSPGTNERQTAGSMSHGISQPSASVTGLVIGGNTIIGASSSPAIVDASSGYAYGNRELNSSGALVAGSVDREDLVLRGQGYVAYGPTNMGAISASSAVASGTAEFTAVGLHAGEIVTNVTCVMLTNGATLSLVKVGLYDKTGTRLAISADNSASFTSGAPKLITTALTAPYTVLADDLYYLAIIAVGTTGPTLGRGNGTFDAPKLGGTSPAIAARQAGQTDLPSSATYTAQGPAYWLGAS
jgi:hypothetical protein